MTEKFTQPSKKPMQIFKQGTKCPLCGQYIFSKEDYIKELLPGRFCIHVDHITE
jgi:hypothetical protein